MNRFERLRYERGLTQAQVEEGSGVPVRTVRSLEGPDAPLRPSAPTVKALADFYGVSVAELLGLPEQEAA